ncbi:MAG: FTR1 family protein, partial [Chitinophagales bacterium]
MNEFIITFRESLEAALIVGIIYVILHKNGLHSQKRMLWLSVIFSVLASAVLGIILNRSLETLPAGTQELLEGVLMYITAALLFYVIFWMAKNLANRQAIQQQTDAALSGGKKWGVFFLVFFAILREGFETALFLLASTNIDSNFSYAGFFGGIILAVLIGYLIVIQGKKIQLKPFFKYTSLLLVFFAAGMIAYGTHEIHEYLEEKEHAEQIAKGGTAETHAEENKVYDIFKSKTEADNPSAFWYNKSGDKYIHILHDKGSVGVFFKGLFGYNSDPIWPEVILWFL